jgi:hypothetical protein
MGHGTFVWNELLTRDLEGAKTFFASVVGWTFRSMPLENGTYWIAEIEGKPVAGLMEMPETLPPTVPPHWFAYLQVDDVDARLELATAHGGQIVRPPFDVPDVGRLGFIEDSTGAKLGLMTPVPKA